MSPDAFLRALPPASLSAVSGRTAGNLLDGSGRTSGRPARRRLAFPRAPAPKWSLELRRSLQKTNARSPRFCEGNFNVLRLATTNNRRPVDDVVVNLIVPGPIQKPILSSGAN